MTLLTGNEPAFPTDLPAGYIPSSKEGSGFTIRQQLAKDFMARYITKEDIEIIIHNGGAGSLFENYATCAFAAADVFIRVNNELEAKTKER